MKDGIDRIAAERTRQINKENYTPEHDDGHDAAEMAKAAACYALPRNSRYQTAPAAWPWPWSIHSWKPSKTGISGRVRDLEKAGALIAAEIDRLQRMTVGGALEAEEAGKL